MILEKTLKEGFISEWQPGEQAFRAIFAGLDEALFIYDGSGDLRFLNVTALEPFYRYLYPPGTSEHPLELFDSKGEPLAPEEHPLKRVLKGETFSLDLRVSDPQTGQRQLHSCSAWVVEQDETLCVLKSVNMTEHREAEERFSTCFNENPIPTIIIALRDLCVIDVNQSFLTITGFDKSEVTDKNFAQLNLFANSEEGDKLLGHLRQNQIEEGTTHELSLQVRSGDVLHVIIHSQPIKLHGEPCLLGTLLDVTDRKRTEEQLMQAIQEVMQDTAWFSRSVMEKLAQLRSDSSDKGETVNLSKRERQLLELMAKGLDNAQIEDELGLAKTTVRNYIARIYGKLGVHSRTEAIIWARERGIVAQ